MTTGNNSRRGDVGRPRSVENIDIFHATTRVLHKLGSGRLTLAAIAAEAGCTAPAISQRFGSKAGLLDAYLAWVSQMITTRFQAARDSGAPPLKALLARFEIPPQERAEEFAQLLELPNHRAGSQRPIIRETFEIWHRETLSMLHLAREANEIVDVDLPHLADVLISAMMGATFQASSLDDPTLTARYRTMFEFILAPYRTRGASGSGERRVATPE